MNKKIVVITGSPRKKGNSFAMTEAFIKAADTRQNASFAIRLPSRRKEAVQDE